MKFIFVIIDLSFSNWSIADVFRFFVDSDIATTIVDFRFRNIITIIVDDDVNFRKIKTISIDDELLATTFVDNDDVNFRNIIAVVDVLFDFCIITTFVDDDSVICDKIMIDDDALFLSKDFFIIIADIVSSASTLFLANFDFFDFFNFTRCWNRVTFRKFLFNACFYDIRLLIYD